MEDMLSDVQDVRRLTIAPGDILLVTVPPNTSSQRVEVITERLRRTIPAGVEILVVTGDVRMAILTRAQD